MLVHVRFRHRFVSEAALDEEIEALDETDVHFGDELLQMAAFETLADDEQQADATWKLTRVRVDDFWNIIPSV